MGSSMTTATSYERGTVIIDAWDAAKKELIWRGSIQAIFKENPDKAMNQFNKGLNKLGNRWEKMRRNEEVVTYDDLDD